LILGVIRALQEYIQRKSKKEPLNTGKDGFNAGDTPQLTAAKQKSGIFSKLDLEKQIAERKAKPQPERAPPPPRRDRGER